MQEYQEGARSRHALTCDYSGMVGTGAPSVLLSGQALHRPAPLFKKLDGSLTFSAATTPTLRQPAPLFEKLDENVVEQEHARLGVTKR